MLAPNVKMRRLIVAMFVLAIVPFAGVSSGAAPSPPPLSPTALVGDHLGKNLYVAAGTGNRVLRYDLEKSEVTGWVEVPGAPSGLALSADEQKLYVTCAAPESAVAIIEVSAMKVSRVLAAGHNALSPVLSKDEQVLYVCNRFNNEVAFIDLQSGETVRHVRVEREPVAQAITPDGRFLFVANHIHAGRADLDVVAGAVSVVETKLGQARTIELPNGSGQLRGVAVSPDGKIACVTHLLSRFHLPTTQLERGWVNTAALSLIDVLRMQRINTVLLDNIDRGAANPWDVKWSPDGARILVTHAGTHEVSVIDTAALLAKLARLPARRDPNTKVDYTIASHVASDVPNDLSFLAGLRQRIKLPPGDHGPRALAVIGTKAHVVNYFSDTLNSFTFAEERPVVQTLALGPCVEPTKIRKGEFYFNDASICFQGWQSCASCHSSDARVDGLNWDNLNDGIGNPKNAKSLLLSHRTPSAMWLAVRESAEVAVRAGIRHSLFTVQPEEVAESMDEYLRALKPEPSPLLVKGELSESARRGEKIFAAVGCTGCHKAPLFTDMNSHNVGTRSRYDKPTDCFDTPTLVEVWRSAPYLHDGSAATIREVLTSRNPAGEHGVLTGLSPDDIDDLAAYVLSL